MTMYVVYNVIRCRHNCEHNGTLKNNGKMYEKVWFNKLVRVRSTCSFTKDPVLQN